MAAASDEINVVQIFLSNMRILFIPIESIDGFLNSGQRPEVD